MAFKEDSIVSIILSIEKDEWWQIHLLIICYAKIIPASDRWLELQKTVGDLGVVQELSWLRKLEAMRLIGRREIC